MENNVPQMPGNNGGQLNAGGTPGNRGGTGRPPDEIRKRFREVLAGAGMERVEAIIRKSEEGDVLKAVDLCGKYGLGEAKVLVPEELTRVVADVLMSCEFLSHSQRDEIGKKLDAAVKDL